MTSSFSGSVYCFPLTALYSPKARFFSFSFFPPPGIPEEESTEIFWIKRRQQAIRQPCLRLIRQTSFLCPLKSHAIKFFEVKSTDLSWNKTGNTPMDTVFP